MSPSGKVTHQAKTTKQSKKSKKKKYNIKVLKIKAKK